MCHVESKYPSCIAVQISSRRSKPHVRFQKWILYDKPGQNLIVNVTVEFSRRITDRHSAITYYPCVFRTRYQKNRYYVFSEIYYIPRKDNLRYTNSFATDGEYM